MKQLRLTRPVRHANAERMTDRQQALLAYLRGKGEPVNVDWVAVRYVWPRRACDRLVRRGLLVKVAPGVYQARALRERKA